MTIVVLEAFGDRARLARVPAASTLAPRAAAEAARRIAAALREKLPGADVVVGGRAVLVFDAGEGLLEIDVDPEHDESARASRAHAIDVVYDGEDLEAVASASGLSVREVIERHAARAYEVEIVGFLPGFAYLAEIDPALVLPRRPSPRKRVPAGSVAIAGRYTGVYPSGSPGGWHLLGRAIDPRLFEADRSPPARLSPGDTVRFRAVGSAITASDARPRGQNAAATAPAAIEILRAPPHATIQDLGRRGWLASGVPEGGAWDREAHADANRALGNDAGAATLELPHDSFAARALEDVWVAADGERARFVHRGGVFEIARALRAVRYLAIEGGFDVPEVLGSRSTLLTATLGGLEGRRVVKGDRLAKRRRVRPGDPPVSEPAAIELAAELGVWPGPDVERFPPGELARFAQAAFVVSPALDRTGTRLDGARMTRLDADAGAPAPMIRGAVQVATDGTCIVLGPDGATTGGYPVIAVLAEDACAAFARLRPGSPVRFAIQRGV